MRIKALIAVTLFTLSWAAHEGHTEVAKLLIKRFRQLLASFLHQFRFLLDNLD
jgi:hypothetical protein